MTLILLIALMLPLGNATHGPGGSGCGFRALIDHRLVRYRILHELYDKRGGSGCGLRLRIPPGLVITLAADAAVVRLGTASAASHAAPIKAADFAIIGIAPLLGDDGECRHHLVVHEHVRVRTALMRHHQKRRAALWRDDMSLAAQNPWAGVSRAAASR